MSSDLQIGKHLQHTPLTMEMYQRIHATALQRAMRGLHLHAVPNHIDVEQLKQHIARIGSDGCLIHPSDAERIFAGVTPETYETIRGLYCSRLGRSIAMVHRILQMLCRQEGAPLPTYEAVWAICLYLEKRRRESVDVSVVRTTGAWWIGKLSPAVRIPVEKDAFYLPGIFCIIDTHTQHMLAFRIAPLDTQAESIPLALYDAITAQRQPHPFALAGLLWQLPRRIITEETLSPACFSICKRMGIQVESTTRTQPLLEILRGTWADLLPQQTERFMHFSFATPLITAEPGQQQNRNVLPFPEPLPLFTSLAHRWQMLEGPPLAGSAEQLIRASACVVSKYRLRSLTREGSLLAPVGYLGWIEYECLRYNPRAIASLNALARLAFFTGTGYLTAYGMGSTTTRLSS